MADPGLMQLDAVVRPGSATHDVKIDPATGRIVDPRFPSPAQMQARQQLMQRLAPPTDPQIAAMAPTVPQVQIPQPAPSMSMGVAMDGAAPQPQVPSLGPYRPPSIDPLPPAPQVKAPFQPVPIQSGPQMEQSALGTTAAIAPLITAAYARNPGQIAQGLNAYSSAVQNTTRLQNTQRQLQLMQRQSEQQMALGMYREAQGTRRAQTQAVVEYERLRGQRLGRLQAQANAARKAQLDMAKLQLKTGQESVRDQLRAQELQLKTTQHQQKVYQEAIPIISEYSDMRTGFQSIEGVMQEAIDAGWWKEQQGIRGFMNWMGRGFHSGFDAVTFNDSSEADRFMAWLDRVQRVVMPQAFSTIKGEGQVTEGERQLLMQSYGMEWDGKSRVIVKNAHSMANVLQELYRRMDQNRPLSEAS